MVVHELSICIGSKQTMILFVIVCFQYTLAPTSTFSRQESIMSRQITGESLVHILLAKIDEELIMPMAVITPGSHFYQGGV